MRADQLAQAEATLGRVRELAEQARAGSGEVWLEDLVAALSGESVGLPVDRVYTLAYEAGWRDARSTEQAVADSLVHELTEAEATIDRVRTFVDGFAERGDGLPLSTTDQLWILAIRKQLDADEVDRG